MILIKVNKIDENELVTTPCIKSDPGTSSSSAGTSSGGVGEGVKDLSIYINSTSAGGATVTLAPSLSLTEVSETHWKVNKPMEMLYSFKRV